MLLDLLVAAGVAWLVRTYVLREPLKLWIAIVAFFPLLLAVGFGFEQSGLIGPAFEPTSVSTALFVMFWILVSKKE